MGHYGRELSLMLEGKKPLSAFSLYKDERGLVDFGEHEFDKYVKDGNLVKKEKEIHSRHGYAVVYVLYALPDQKWRLNAYLNLMHFLQTRAWCSHLEWLQGSLLGYSDAENDAHIRAKYGAKGEEPH